MTGTIPRRDDLLLQLDGGEQATVDVKAERQDTEMPTASGNTVLS